MIGQYHRLLQKTWNEQVDQKLFDIDLANLFAGKRTKELSVNVEDLLLTYAINTVTFTWVQNEKKQLREFMNFKNNVRPTLKSCSFFIHQPGEIKTSRELPTGRNFFLQCLCLKRSAIKRFKLISSWYNKNVALLYIYIQFLCSFFMLIHHNLMIDINQSPVLCPHTNKTN